MSQRFSANRFTAVIDEDLDGSELTVSLDVNGSNPMTIAINDGTNEVDASFVVRGESLRALLSWLMIESRKQRGGRGLLELDAPAESVDISPTERPEQRWHEIATEGLPVIDPPATGSTRAAFWTFDTLRRQRILNFYVPSNGVPAIAPIWEGGSEGGATVTHWYPIKVPAPPTQEPHSVKPLYPADSPDPSGLRRVGWNDRLPERCPTCQRWRPGSVGYPRDAKPKDRCACVRGGA